MSIEYLGRRAVEREDGISVSCYFAGVDCDGPVHYRQVRSGNMFAVFEDVYFVFSFYGKQYRAFYSTKMTCHLLVLAEV